MDQRFRAFIPIPSSHVAFSSHARFMGRLVRFLTHKTHLHLVLPRLGLLLLVTLLLSKGFCSHRSSLTLQPNHSLQSVAILKAFLAKHKTDESPHSFFSKCYGSNRKTLPTELISCLHNIHPQERRTSVAAFSPPLTFVRGTYPCCIGRARLRMRQN